MVTTRTHQRSYQCPSPGRRRPSRSPSSAHWRRSHCKGGGTRQMLGSPVERLEVDPFSLCSACRVVTRSTPAIQRADPRSVQRSEQWTCECTWGSSASLPARSSAKVSSAPMLAASRSGTTGRGSIPHASSQMSRPPERHAEKALRTRTFVGRISSQTHRGRSCLCFAK